MTSGLCSSRCSRQGAGAAGSIPMTCEPWWTRCCTSRRRGVSGATSRRRSVHGTGLVAVSPLFAQWHLGAGPDGAARGRTPRGRKGRPDALDDDAGTSQPGRHRRGPTPRRKRSCGSGSTGTSRPPFADACCGSPRRRPGPFRPTGFSNTRNVDPFGASRLDPLGSDPAQRLSDPVGLGVGWRPRERPARRVEYRLAAFSRAGEHAASARSLREVRSFSGPICAEAYADAVGLGW